MSSSNHSGAAALLERWRQGDQRALEQLYILVEAELRRLARGRIRQLRTRLRARGVEPSLETTQLVNDAYLRLMGEDRAPENRAHLLAIAAYKMRAICSEYARRALATKRGRTAANVPLNSAAGARALPAVGTEDLIALDRALARLAKLDETQARIVEMRFYAGCTDAEIAEALGLSEATVRRRWRSARALLHRELEGRARAGEEE